MNLRLTGKIEIFVHPSTTKQLNISPRGFSKTKENKIIIGKKNRSTNLHGEFLDPVLQTPPLEEYAYKLVAAHDWLMRPLKNHQRTCNCQQLTVPHNLTNTLGKRLNLQPFWWSSHKVSILFSNTRGRN